MKNEAYFIVDDVIDEAGTEGYEVMYGTPLDAVGFSRHKCKTYSEARRYVMPHVLKGEAVYRVKLARRHGAFSCKPIRFRR